MIRLAQPLYCETLSIQKQGDVVISLLILFFVFISTSCQALTIKKKTVLKGHTGAISQIVQLENGNIATTSCDTTIKLWPVQKTYNQKPSCLMTLQGHTAPVWSLYQLDAKTIISTSKDKTIRCWRLNWNENKYNNTENHPVHKKRPIDIFAKKENGDVFIYETNQESDHLFLKAPIHNKILKREDSSLIIINPITQEKTVTFNGYVDKQKNDISTATILSDGTVAAAFVHYNEACDWNDPYNFSNFTTSIQLWRDKKVIKTLLGHSKLVSSLVELSNNILVSAAHGGWICFWDITKEQSLITSLDCHCAITSMAFFGGDLYVGLYNGKVKVYTIS